MASSKMALMAVAMVLVAASFESAATAYEVCKMTRKELWSCSPAVRRSPARPTRECCVALRDSDLKCFCKYRYSPLLSVFGIERKHADTLPVRCGLTAGPVC
ncbi:PREDICTED: putative lipid-transfer protein DIR1 [Tarenaya hassleriana]|uniref:putative lipid-transfer protein DIR1 n=1 Tax=Tarenaya hassleriana TaxID=28532 RepID=UPI00053C7AB2|nr:PREDICTED: putative lipid-transfer protein DIR1 [Tarenaya hassleriana]